MGIQNTSGQKKRGRKSKFTPKLGLRICELLVEGKSLRTICRKKGMPSPSMVFRWKEENREFREQYARAREEQAELLAEEIIEIADKPRVGRKIKRIKNNEGKVVTEEIQEGDMVERSRLQLDARKWVASKLLPKQYGDKPDVAAASTPLDEVLAGFREQSKGSGDF